MLTDEKIEEMATTLAKRIAARLGSPLAPAAESGSRTRLILPANVRLPGQLDEHTRARHERRIQFITGRYGIPWLIDQALDGAPSLEAMPDAALLGLLADCEKALKCVQENVSFEDAGLVRSWA